MGTLPIDVYSMEKCEVWYVIPQLFLIELMLNVVINHNWMEIWNENLRISKFCHDIVIFDTDITDKAVTLQTGVHLVK